MFPNAAAFAVAIMIAQPPALQLDRVVDTREALAALRAARAGDEGEANALAGRPFRVVAPIAASDWSYDPTFGVLTYRPRPTFWNGPGDPQIESAIGLRLDDGGAEPLGIVLASQAFDWFMGGEGLAGVRIPVTPQVAADASRSLRLVIEGQIEPMAGRRAVACAGRGQGCILGARIDDLVLVYGPTNAPHVLARWDPASLE
jgi:hypothetical protein